MKKILLTVLILLFVGAAFSFAAAGRGETVKVTFVMPEGHHFTEIPDEPSFFKEYRHQSVTVQFEKGHILTEQDVEPYTHHCNSLDRHRECRVSMIGWDINPVGVRLDHDMTFTAVMNEDVKTLTVSLEKGYFITEFVTVLEDNTYLPKIYSSFSMKVDKGYVINENDVEIFKSTLEGGFGRPKFVVTGFDKEPLNYEVNEETEFMASTLEYYIITVALPAPKRDIFIENHSIWVLEGEKLTMDNIQEKFGYMLEKDNLPEGVAYAYWDVTDEQLANINSDMIINAVYVWRGDTNLDSVINTSDAVFILKAAAGMMELNEAQTKAGDCNGDGKVNTADAVLILKYAAGMITSF